MQIKVYTTPTCGFCTMLKQYLTQKGVKFEEIDVAKDPSKAEEARKLSGQTGVPVLVADKEVIVGFDKEKIDDLIK